MPALSFPQISCARTWDSIVWKDHSTLFYYGKQDTIKKNPAFPPKGGETPVSGENHDPSADPLGGNLHDAGDIAFVRLALPIMVGPGAIATILGLASMVKQSDLQLEAVVAISMAILLTMLLTYLALAYARVLLGRIGPRGIDAATRIVGFFVTCMGMGLIFHGAVEAPQSYGVITVR